MKAVALKGFQDLSEGVYRNPGDVFDVTKQRFDQICKELDGFIADAEPKKDKKEDSPVRKNQ